MVRINITKEEAEWVSYLIEQEITEHNDMTDLLLAKMEWISGKTKFEEFSTWVKDKLKPSWRG